MTNPANPRAYELLLEAVASARSGEELDKLRQVARQHYAGVMLEDVEAEIAARWTALAAARQQQQSGG